MRRAIELRTGATWRFVVTAAALAGCGSKTPPTSPTCDQACQDGVALRALRETMKFAYNRTVQNMPVGPQDASTDGFLSGTAQVSGRATVDPLQGTTEVHLTYVFNSVNYMSKDNDPKQNYNVVIDGVLLQDGILAVQPSATTALTIRVPRSNADGGVDDDGGVDEDAGMSNTLVRITGTVYDPPLDYHLQLEDAGGDQSGCVIAFTQSGNNLAGHFCGRDVGFQF